MELKKKLVNLLVLTTLVALPLVAVAYYVPGQKYDSTFTVASGKTLIQNIVQMVLDIIWEAFLGFAIIMFITTGYYFLIGKADEGKKTLLYGVIGVITGILAWGLPGLVYSWLG